MKNEFIVSGKHPSRYQKCALLAKGEFTQSTKMLFMLYISFINRREALLLTNCETCTVNLLRRYENRGAKKLVEILPF